MNQLSPSTPVPVWSPQLLQAITRAPDLASAASIMALHRVPLFPCVRHGKRPLVEHGFHEATNDPHVVESWWRRWPDANIAIPTGAVSGVDVVDVDVHLNGSGFAAFAEARRHGFGDRWAWMIRTPSGGMHAYYLRSTPDDQRSWQIPRKHVDFRGDGGYIVAPPSATDAGAYRLVAVSTGDPRSIDGPGLRNFLDPPRQIPSGPRSRRLADATQLAAWVAKQPEGGRNQGLFWAACRMVESGHRFDDAVATLGDAAQRAGLGEREALATIRSAYRSAASRSRHTGRPPPEMGRRPVHNTSEGIEL